MKYSFSSALHQLANLVLPRACAWSRGQFTTAEYSCNGMVYLIIRLYSILFEFILILFTHLLFFTLLTSSSQVTLHVSVYLVTCWSGPIRAMLGERAHSLKAFGIRILIKNIIIQQFRREVVMISKVVRILPGKWALVQIVARVLDPVHIPLEPPTLGKTHVIQRMHATSFPAVLLQYPMERAMAHMLVPS
jgi:hypothetical protein